MQAMAIDEQETEQEAMPGAVSMVSRLLERVADANDQNRRVVSDRRRRRSVSAFHGVTRPGISIDGYLRRIFKYANCSPSCFVVAYVYLDRFTLSNPSIPIDSFNVHRLLVTSVMLSAKFMDDLYYNNAYYAKVGGISTAEINLLELDFLFGLRFQLNVTPDTFTTYCSYLHKEFLLHSPKPLKLHHCFNEDESTSHQKELAF